MLGPRAPLLVLALEMDNIMASVLNVLIASALFVVVLCTVLYLLRWVVRYEINGEAIRIKLLGIATIRQISIREIEAIMVVPLADSFLFRGGIQKEVLLGERWPSVWLVSKCVFIKKVSGLSRFIWLSPKNPEEFVETILHLKQSLAS